jgi:mannosyl-3-phosphoglycerate phosphatase
MIGAEGLLPTPELLRIQRVVVFTDLDGTLLDHHTYAPALEAMQTMKEQGVPLIPITSKTVAETTTFFSRCGLRMPFIAENGAIIAVPSDYFDPSLSSNLGTPYETKEGYDIYNYGIPYTQVTKAFDEVRGDLITNGKISAETLVAFHDMTPEQFAEMVGFYTTDGQLDIHRAQMALTRDAQLGYTVNDENQGDIVEEVTRMMQEKIPGIKATRGGRFYQLGGADKGQAATRLMEVFRAYNPNTVFVGFGDASGDFPFLRLCDYGYFVGKPTELPEGIHQVAAQGPDGVNLIIRQMFGGTI